MKTLLSLDSMILAGESLGRAGPKMIAPFVLAAYRDNLSTGKEGDTPLTPVQTAAARAWVTAYDRLHGPRGPRATLQLLLAPT